MNKREKGDKSKSGERVLAVKVMEVVRGKHCVLAQVFRNLLSACRCGQLR